jgi:murein DD-endopeptidase MepM/ murein hydrolase activator NlpD
LAEFLDVRGGAVIIDHGLGLYSGFYHMSEILIAPGASVTTNQEIGKVGSTGLSTGNHLHWDLLINNTWIDPGDWVNSNRACWLSEGYGQPCQ